MFSRIGFILSWLRRPGASRSNLLIENLALRQQLGILSLAKTSSALELNGLPTA
jgi:hypothetical protein